MKETILSMLPTQAERLLLTIGGLVGWAWGLVFQHHEAAAVCFADTIAGGLATKTIIPKGFMGLGERTARVADVGAQAVLQGSLGSAGEAASQYVTNGKITSWADVIAEFAGEFTTSPIDVAAASLGRTTEAKVAAAAAREFAERTAQLEQYAKVSTLLANDPKTAAEYVKNIHAQSQVPDLFIDAQSLHQSGNDGLITEASPELAERYQQALTSGESMKISAEELFTILAPRDTNNALAEVVHPEGMPSLVEAQSLEQTMAQETTERLSQTLEGVTGEFATSSANVGKRVETMLTEAYGDNTDVKTGGMSMSARKLAVTYLQTLFTTVARDLGVLPEEVFNKYGPQMFLSPADATRTADGKLQVISDRAKGLFSGKQNDSLHMTSKVFEGNFASFMLSDKDSERFVIRTPLSQATGSLLNQLGIPTDDVEIQVTSDRRAHPYKAGHTLSANDWIDALNLPSEAESAKVEKQFKDGQAISLRKTASDGKLLEAIYVVSHNPNRVDAATRLNFITAYRVGENLSKPDVATAREVARLDFESRHMRDSMPERAYDAAQKRAVGFDSISDTVSRSTKNKQSLSQNTIGDWFPDVRAIATWAGANRSTFLHETGHMFLDMRTRIALDLKAKKASGVELTKGEQHLLETAEAAMTWLGTDLESFVKMSVNEQRPMHEKFARSYEAYIMEGHSPSSALTKIFRSFSGWLRGVYRLITNIPEAEINPEVRDLFDSMLVASSED